MCFSFETFGFQTFSFMELISFNSIYEFLFFSSINLKLLDDIQIFHLVEVVFKESFGSLRR